VRTLRSGCIAIVSLVCLLAAAGSALSSVPGKINYQGRLLDSSGAPLTGSLEVGFRIYDSRYLGTLLWSDTTMVTADEDGIFSAMLGGDRPCQS